MQEVKLFCDGASRGNPGPGGYGGILQYVDNTGKLHEKEFSGGYACTTNNRMELLACIVCFESLKFPCRVHVYSDSQYVVNAFNQQWITSWKNKGWKNSKKKLVKNADLWKRLLLAVEPHQVTWNWLRGHSGHDENERCDVLATTAADASHLPVDEGYVEE